VVVGVDEAGGDDVPTQVEDAVGGGRERVGGANRLDDAVAGEEGGVGDLGAGVVHGDEDVGVGDEQG
jgi:hypothetical protein